MMEDDPVNKNNAFVSQEDESDSSGQPAPKSKAVVQGEEGIMPASATGIFDSAKDVVQDGGGRGSRPPLRATSATL